MPLDPERLSSRVRDLLRGQPGPTGTRDRARALGEADPPDPDVRETRYVDEAAVPLAAETLEGCTVIERHYDLDCRHGRATVGEYAAALSGHLPALAVLAADQRAVGAEVVPTPGRFEWDRRRPTRDERRKPAAPTAGPLLFFDLETTGLSGGVGTLAFLVGCGYFDEAGFHTRQYFLSGYEAEHDLLAALAGLAGRFGGLVSFNGRSFDVPLIDMRYAFHRLESPFEGLAHFDMLHPARRLWRRRNAGSVWDDEEWALSAPGGEDASCTLKALEEAVLRTGRIGDVPGFEIPSRYFGYLRSGDLEPLQAVFEHNRLDLLSLAALTAVAARMASEGPEAAPSPHEALALGQLYERAGRVVEAEVCYVRAGGCGQGPWDPRCIETSVRVDALRRLALIRRRQRRHGEAAEAWEALLGAGAGPAAVQEARRALAIHHEHRTRDLASARTIAETALRTERDPDRVGALRHRLDRLNRKLGKPAAGEDAG